MTYAMLEAMECGDSYRVDMLDINEAVAASKLVMAVHNRSYKWHIVDGGAIFIRIQDPLGQKQWPFKLMRLGDEVTIPKARAKKAQTYAAVFGSSNGMKFKTRTMENGELYVTRVI